MAADCELDRCGVLAIGRCVTCGRAFCAGHAAFDGLGRMLVNQCAPCGGAQAARESAARFAASPQGIIPGLAERLSAAGVPTEPVSDLIRRWEVRRGLFRRGGDYVNYFKPVGTGWEIGAVHWEWVGERDTFRSAPVLTAIIAEDAEHPTQRLIRADRDEATGQLCRTGSLAGSRRVDWAMVHAGVDALAGGAPS